MTDQSIPAGAPAPHRIERLRFKIRRRTLRVARVSGVTPNMLRVTLAGPELAGFVSAGFDDHVKLFVPGADGAAVRRDYTPRRHDAVKNELDLDFALHEAGPATLWALGACVGDPVEIAGPRGSMVVSDDFDWYLLIGDETALPAIGRRLEELRPGARAVVFAEVAGPQEEQVFQSAAQVSVTWVHRGAAQAGMSDLLEAAVSACDLPGGEGYAFVACEARAARRLRNILVAEKGHPKGWIRAAAYWRRGTADAHEVIDDAQ